MAVGRRGIAVRGLDEIRGRSDRGINHSGLLGPDCVNGFLWHQGIDDAIHGKLASQYERNLTELIGSLRKRYGSPQTPFVLARSVNSRIAQPTPDPEGKSPMAVVRRAQVAVGESVPFATWINVDDLPNVNTHHFSADSQLVIGERYGNAFLKLAAKSSR